MHPSRRRKKRPNYGIRTVEVMRGPNGFGFTISGQQPCILSCIVSNSPADQAGLRAGDFLISVNGVSVSKITHDAVVNLIGNCIGPIKMTIAENYYSDSSDEELDMARVINTRKPKYTHKPRSHRPYKTDTRISTNERMYTDSPNKKAMKLRECSNKQYETRNGNLYKEEPTSSNSQNLNVTNPIPMEDEAGPIEYKVLVGYLGTIEMPKQLLPNSRLQTVCSCIRKLRQEKRTPTAVLMTVLPTCLTLKNSSNNILAIYPTNRVVYISTTTDKESRYFGLVTSAVCDSRSMENMPKTYRDQSWQDPEKKCNNLDEKNVEISNSCHVFVTDPKIIDHKIHFKKAENFKITCTADVVTGNCLEFPKNALYIVSLVQNMYRLQDPFDGKNNRNKTDDNLAPVANSPQPSASSNSDSGIGFRDDCGNVSDRILVVEFPAHRPFPVISPNNKRPLGIDASNFENLDLPLNNDQNYHSSLNNVRFKNRFDFKHMNNNLSKKENVPPQLESKQSNINNIRACENTPKYTLEKSESFNINNIHGDYLKDETEQTVEINRLTVRAMPDPKVQKIKDSSPYTNETDTTNTNKYSERAVDVPDDSPSKKSYESVSLNSMTEEIDFKSSTDNISMHSSKSVEFGSKGVFKTPSVFLHNKKKPKRHLKLVSSCDNLTNKYEESILNYKLSPKVYGMSKPNYSCEELNLIDGGEKCAYGSLQDLCSWTGQCENRRNIAQSEPDVRIPRDQDSSPEATCEQNAVPKCNNSEGPAGWAASFEKLLDDPLGLHTFAEFLKKEFSAENIYFWTACERYRRLPPGKDRVSEAQRIYRQHLCVGAPEPVNVDSQGRQCTEQFLQNADSKLFDQAQKQIFNLMKFDSYPRFLKSDLYKQCLSGNLDRPQFDVGLLLQPAVNTPTKLKKSLSNAEDRRRKSLLPWHRKNRSKSKDRGETEYIQRKCDEVISKPESVPHHHRERHCGSDIHSSKSSLTSLDISSSLHESIKGSQDELSSTRSALCRVILSNGSTTVVQIRRLETIQQLVNRLLDKRGLVYSSFEVYTDKHGKAVSVNEPSSKLAGCEVTVEQRVVFKLDLPNRKVIAVKSKYTKIIVDVLRPILHKYNYSLDQVKVTVNGNEVVDVSLPVTSIDGARLNVQLCDSMREQVAPPAIKVNMKVNHSLDEITNKVYEDILQEKADTVCSKNKSDRGSVKSEDWGSEHSSGIFGRFLRRDSGVHEKKKKSLVPRPKGNSNHSSIEDVAGEHNTCKKPLIAKWKSGVKLQVACSESEELYEGLSRAQRSRLEDQRGTEINFELPDFLKDKENEHHNSNHFHSKPPRRMLEPMGENSRFYLTESGIVHSKHERLNPSVAAPKNLKLNHSNYENKNIHVSDFAISKITNGNSAYTLNNHPNNNHSKFNNIRIYSPNKLSSDESGKSNYSTPTKNNGLDVTVIENKNLINDSQNNNNSNSKNNEPPPLPPKPKILPIKPSNWGQNGFFRTTKDISPNDRSKQSLYLEQPTSSFV